MWTFVPNNNPTETVTNESNNDNSNHVIGGDDGVEDFGVLVNNPRDVICESEINEDNGLDAVAFVENFEFLGGNDSLDSDLNKYDIQKDSESEPDMPNIVAVIDATLKTINKFDQSCPLAQF